MARAVSPLVAVVLLVGITVVGSAMLLGSVDTELSEPAPRASLSVSVDATPNRISVTHRGGEDIDVSRLNIHITVEGQQLQYQPPVPFFAADGFVSGPEGAFNSAGSHTLRAGDTAALSLAATNDPEIHYEDRVTVQIATETSVLYENTITAS